MENYLEWGYLGLFVASFLAATVIPLSSEFVLSILLANQYPLALSLIIASLGNWLGGLSSYGLGRLGKWSLIERFFGLKKNKIQQIKRKIDRWGSYLAFFCWLPIVGDLFAISLGFFKVSFSNVSVWMLFGKLLRYAVWGLLTLWGIRFF